MISKQNHTNIEKVKRVEEDLCEKIKHTTEQTRQISMFTKERGFANVNLAKIS